MRRGSFRRVLYVGRVFFVRQAVFPPGDADILSCTFPFEVVFVAVAIEFRCHTCGKLLRTGEENAGRPAACPACGDRVAVPVSGAEAGAVSVVTDHVTDGGNAARRSMREHRGGIILAFGILSWVSMCFLFGVAAWALAVEDLRAMRAGEMDATGERITRAGMILGAISVVLTMVVLLGMVGAAGIAIAVS
ncbi:MAG: hypothetical protein M3552_09100 [Planctomycetota bacterium]|nr:hypothetical protein [Planctomycetota bacterium]